MINKLSNCISQLFASGRAWIGVVVVIGGFLAIIYKFQNTTLVFEGPYYKPNFHPYFQTMTMFTGQMLSLPIFYILRSRNPAHYRQSQNKAVLQGKKLGMNRILLLVPAVIDLLSSSLQFLALNYIPPSAYEMIEGGNIVTTFVFSILVLKHKFLKRQLIGSCLTFIGIVTVGLANTIFSQDTPSSNIFMQFVGYGLVLLSLALDGMYYVYEQKIMQKYHLETLYIVGYEGLFGFVMYGMLIPVLCYVPCPFGMDACVYDISGMPYMESFTAYIDQLHQKPYLFSVLAVAILQICVANIAGVSITKHINALARVLSNMSKSIFIWACGLVVTLALGDTYPNLSWEKLQPWVMGVQGVGFCFMALGNLVYVNVVRISGLGTDNQDRQDYQQQIKYEKLPLSATQTEQ